MPFRSILNSRDFERRNAPEYFIDLNLDQLVDSITAGRDEYNLKPFFYVPAHDVGTINYRHDVFRDLEKQALLVHIYSFADKMRTIRSDLSRSDKLYYKLQKQSWFLHAVDTYCGAIRRLTRDIVIINPHSRGLSEFLSHLIVYTESSDFRALIAETERLRIGLSEIKYSVHIEGSRITVGQYEIEPDYGADVLQTFERFKLGAPKDYPFEFTSQVEMNHVEAAILDRVALLNPGIFSSLDEYCTRRRFFQDQTIRVFDREIQFYIACLEYTDHFKSKGLSFCYPAVSDNSKEICGRDVFDLALAEKLRRENASVVTNDFDLRNQERIIVVSGPNQGGKTTFARTFGQLHHLAAIGCPVPGKEARLYLFDRMFTHFEREEDLENLSGKLEDDLRRIHQILEQATSDSILIMNESFVSTTLSDALFLSKQIMGQIIARDMLCVSVTFLDELASLGERHGQHGEHGSTRGYSAKDFQDPSETCGRTRLRGSDRRKVPPHLREREEAHSAMKAHLMYKDRDFDLQEKVPPNSSELVNDLEIDTLWAAMAGGDSFLLEVAKKSVLTSLKLRDDIVYRQQILIDCLDRSAIVREMYVVATEAVEREKKVWGSIFGRYPEGLLTRSLDVLAIFVAQLKRLRSIADLQRAGFHSEGFTRFFDMISTEMNDEYLNAVDEHLRRMRFKDSGLLMSAELGKGNKGTDYILRKPRDAKRGWRVRLRQWFERLASGDRYRFVYEVDPRDEAGHRALSELKGRGISQVAAALAQSTDHILSFFVMLRTELGFYIGCLNLRDQLIGKGEPICLPEPMSSAGMYLSVQGLYDVCLSLKISHRVVGNDVQADGKALVMITGANRGGKSTFLRSVGLAQMMMQCGMFSPSQSFRANICDGVYTHFKREEDRSMRSGKLDEELSRMSAMIDRITPNSLVLLNESFGSTNEREGSEIARQIVRALLESGVKVLYVTHMFDLAIGFYHTMSSDALFLRAERLTDGSRTFRLLGSEPLPTSYGEDLYKQIFGSGQVVKDTASSL